MTIGQRIKNRRLELGLSVDEVAKRLGKNRATVYRYENDDIKELPITVLEPLAKVLDTTPADLIGWDGTNTLSDAQPLEDLDIRIDPDIRRIQRARKNMPESDRKFMMDILTRSFAEYFKDDGGDDPD